MPTLNEYSPDNDKDGFFVRANVGENHPITLQVSTIASRIFKSLNYGDGDNIPTEVVWSMFDFDMLYTVSSIDVESSPSNVDPSEVFQQLDLGNKLSDAERAELISYLEAYDGPAADRINALREELSDDLSEADIDGSSIDGEAWFPNFYKLPKSDDEIRNTLINWTPEEMVDRSRKAFILNEPFTKWSIRTFVTHDALANTPIESIENKEIKYRLNPPNGNKNLTLTDCRGHQKTVSRKGLRDCDYDYFIRRVLSDGTVEEAHVYQDIIVKYHSYHGDSGSSTLLNYDLDDILPPNRSYFGGTEDEPHRANRLTDDYLDRSIEQIKEGVPYPTPSKSNGSEDEDNSGDHKTSSDSGVYEHASEAVDEMGHTEILRVEEMSNNGNPKLYVNSDQLIVVTADISVSEGDILIVELPQKHYSHHMTTKRVVRASNVPKENTTEWIEANL